MHVDNYWNKYLQWMAFSQFHISIDPFVIVDKNDWITNKNNNKNPQPTPVLTVLEHFNLFLRKHPNPDPNKQENVEIIFPDLVIDYAIKHYQIEYYNLWLKLGTFSQKKWRNTRNGCKQLCSFSSLFWYQIEIVNW